MGNIKSTLLELVTQNFSEINKKRRLNKKNNKKTKTKFIHNSTFSISSVLMNSTIRESKNKEKESKEEDLEETTEEKFDDKKEKVTHGGYGTIKPYSGTSSYVKYADYGKIWGHLGIFRAHNMFENTDSNEVAMRNGESTREMISERTLDVGAFNFKYVANMNINNTVQDMTTFASLVVPFGANVDSKEWEKYTLMMKMSVYQAIIALKFKFA